MKIDVLDKGFIKAVDILGTDLTVVNAARISFGKIKSELDDDDRKLMRYLAKHKHYSPFRHIMVTFHIKAPEFVMRQWYKHVVGIETTSSYPTKDHAWNEVSGRYIPIEDFHIPSQLRAAPDNKKQGSGAVMEGYLPETYIRSWEQVTARIVAFYESMIGSGIAHEQARCILPLTLYSEVYWTASFQAIANFLELRLDSHAQKEIRDYAMAVEEIMAHFFPETMAAWFTNKE
jgi:thymidylate synthase (FAD)